MGDNSKDVEKSERVCVLGRSSGRSKPVKETWWLNEEVQENIKNKKKNSKKIWGIMQNEGSRKKENER